MNTKALIDCIKSPVKSQILLYLQKNDELKAKEFLSNNASIPQATLYRALKKMEEEKLIVVSQTNQKRAVIEKTYRLNETVTNMADSLSLSNDAGLYLHMFSEFMTALLLEFDDYAKKEHVDLINDGSGFSAIPIYATKEEMIEYGNQIKEILRPALTKNKEQQKLHTFATIITPPKEGEE